MDLDVSHLPNSMNTFQHMPSNSYRLPPLENAPSGSAMHSVAPMQVASTQAVAAPNAAVAGATAGAVATSSGAASGVLTVVIAVVIVTCVAAVGIFVGVTISNLPSGSSETACSGFSCNNGECISSSLVCDGFDDCLDGDDEDSGCASTNGSPSNTEAVPTDVMATETPSNTEPVPTDVMGPDHFTCIGDSSLIDITKVCDGNDDCPGGTDEDRCLIVVNDSPNGYYVKIYSVREDEYYFPCGQADEWTNGRIEDLCNYLDDGSSSTFTETVSHLDDSGLGIVSNSSVSGLFQQSPADCTNDNVLHITCSGGGTCGTTSRAGKIIGGADADVMDHPWQVSLQRLSVTGWSHFCGGTIVDSQWIVTTAGCVDTISASDYHLYRVRAGITSTDETASDTTAYSILEIIYHPLFNSDTNFIDVAVIRLDGTFNYSDTIAPACLPHPGQIFKDRSNVVASGWGATSEGDAAVTTLKEVTMELWNNDSCRTVFPGLADDLLDGMICAGLEDGGKDTCEYDTGGPLMITLVSTQYLVGLTSWRNGCDRENFTGVYTEVSYVVDWIKREISKVPCSGSTDRVLARQVCDGVEDCPGGTDEDRCVIAPRGYQGGDVQVYSTFTRNYHKFCGYSDGWTTEKSDAVCSYLGYSESTSTTEVVSTDAGIKSTAASFALNDLVQQNAESCTENKVVEIECTPPTSCGVVTSRIVGGADADVEDHPWQIALLRNTTAGTYQFCGGTIVNSQWVVSAAHCVDTLSVSDFSSVKVLVGRTTLALEYSKIYNVEDIIYHPLYSDSTYFMDIAVIRVSEERPISYDDTTRPACLPAPGEIFNDLSPVKATGFGATSEGGSSSNTLQEVTLNLYNKDTCGTTFPNLVSALLDGMVCAGIPEGGKDSCQGDSGGPLIIDDNGLYYLIGATSWGVGCAREGYPGVYADISYIVDWIDRKMA